MKLFDCTSIHGIKIAIPLEKITGIIEVHTEVLKLGNTFIQTGPDLIDGEENGWYVKETFMEIRMALEARK